MGPTRQHELDHTDHTDHTDQSALKYLDHGEGMVCLIFPRRARLGGNSRVNLARVVLYFMVPRCSQAAWRTYSHLAVV